MLRRHASLVLFLPLLSCASETASPEEAPLEPVVRVLGEEHLDCGLSQLILDSDRIVVATVTECREVLQQGRIVPSREWGAVVGGFEHGLGQDVELAMVRVDAAIVAPAALEEMVLLGRRVPADRETTRAVGERGLFFFGGRRIGPYFSRETHQAIRDVSGGMALWATGERVGWSIDAAENVTLPESLRSEFGVQDETAPLADVIAIITQHAEQLLPRCELRFVGGFPSPGERGDEWLATLQSSGVFRESLGEFFETRALLEASAGFGPVHWPEDGLRQILDRLLVLVRDQGRSANLGSRVMHAKALIMDLQTMEGSYFISLNLPFDWTEGQSAANQEAAILMQDFVKALNLQSLPERLEAELGITREGR